METPQSGSIYALLAVNGFKSRIFRSLGSKPVLLSWDVSAKTVSITALDAKGVPTETLVQVNVKQIEHVFIMNGNYVLKIAGQVYDMEIQHYKGQRALVFDLLPEEIGGIASAHTDAKGDGEKLIAFLRQELPPQLMAVSIFKSATRIKASIFLAIIVIIILVIVGVMGASRQ